MHLYIDTADLELVAAYAQYGVLDGVTTNPSLVARTENSYREVVTAIAERTDGAVFAQVIADDVSGMVEQARAYDTWGDDVVVKIPATPAGYEALDQIRDDGIRAGVTVLFSVPQAILAAKNDATFVAPYVGRLSDAGEDGLQVVRDIQTAFDAYGFETEVLAASVRTTQQATELYRAGVDALTLPPAVFEAHFHHHKTDEGLDGFRDDWGDRGDPLTADSADAGAETAGSRR